MKILILVLSYDDGSTYSSFMEAQKKTWDSIEEKGVTTYYFYGNQFFNEIVNNDIKLNIEESLANCGHKTLAAFNLIKDQKFDYLMRTNSSSYVDKSILKRHLNNKPTQSFYSGIIGVTDGGMKFASGSGYIISRDVFDLILANENKWDHSLIDDVALGLMMNDLKINVTQSIRHDTMLDSPAPADNFHYRLKIYENDRSIDIENMSTIYKMKTAAR